MKYKIFRLKNIPTTEDGRIKKKVLRASSFWRKVEEEHELDLGSAVGCYIFSISTGGGELPWYAGRAVMQSFHKECFTPHKLELINDQLSKQRGTPTLTLFVKFTPKDRLAKPTGARSRGTRRKPKPARDIVFLERLLIIHCLKRNEKLLNTADTKFMRDMEVPALVNNGKGKPSIATQELRKLLDLVN